MSLSSSMRLSPPSLPRLPPNLAPCCLHRRHNTRRPTWPTPHLRRLLPIRIPLIQPAQLSPPKHTRVLDRSAIPIVDIHSRNNRPLVHNPDVRKRRLPLDLAAAVSARPVQFPDVGREEVLDGYGAAAVVLEDFVGCVPGAAAVDVGGSGGLAEGGGVFADVGPPA